MIKETQKDRVYMAMKDILAGCPGGMRAIDLKYKIKHEFEEGFPEALLHSIGAQMSDLVKEKDDIFKEWRKGEGTFYFLEDNSPLLPDETSEDEISEDETLEDETPRDEISPSTKRKEDAFYDSFARYLTYPKDENDDESYLKECTKAIAVGGNKFGRRQWLTPDVIGVFKPFTSDSVQFPHEIISVEIKVTRSSSIKALGQACAYRLFSHKVYLVIPKPRHNPDRLEALCHIHGIGLVYFDPDVAEITSSIYDVKILPQRHTPNMDYVNSVIPEYYIDQLYDNHRR